MILENDWRLTGQESYLKGKVLYHRNWRTRISQCDHDHCEFCWKKFSDADGDAHEGYTTADVIIGFVRLASKTLRAYLHGL